MRADGKQPFRRRFLVLMRRDQYLSREIAKRTAAGLPTSLDAAERAALRWAIETLEMQFPEPAASARQDLERDEGGPNGHA